MQRDVQTYLYDIIEAGKLIKEFINGKSFNYYLKDPMLRSAVERQFEIIGEALNCIAKIDQNFLNGISHAKKIINFRNILIHGYAIISNEIVWGVVESDLDNLLDEVEAIYKGS